MADNDRSRTRERENWNEGWRRRTESSSHLSKKHRSSHDSHNRRPSGATSTAQKVASSSISDYIRSAALAIQKKEEANAKALVLQSSKGRWDSSDDEDADSTEKEAVTKEVIDDKLSVTVVQPVITEVPKDISPESEWLQDLEEDEDVGGALAGRGTDSEEVMEVESDSIKEGNAAECGDTAANDLKEEAESEVVCGSRSDNIEVEGESASEHDDRDGARDDSRSLPASAPIAHNPLFHGCRSVEAYQRLNYIDEGTYGMVFRAKDKITGEEVALKQIKFDARHTSKVGFPITALRETNILLALSHPNIVRVKEMVVGSSVDKIYMVMEYLENDLKACMDMSKTPFSGSEVKRLMLQLLGAADHMHQHWYIHRDLKTSNLLYSNKEKKLCVCDFGMARKYGSPLVPYTFEVVTLWYRCPELLLGKRKYSTALDMWSIGCIFAELLLRRPLFMGEGELDQISKIFRVIGAPTEDAWPGFGALPQSRLIPTSISTKSKLQSLFPRTSFGGGMTLSEAGFDLLSRLLHMCPEKRISAGDALAHKWFTEQPYPCPVELMPTFTKSAHASNE